MVTNTVVEQPDGQGTMVMFEASAPADKIVAQPTTITATTPSKATNRNCANASPNPNVDASQAKAKYDNGVLTLTLPKKQASNAQRLHIE